ncbi:MAG TPA: Spo0E family sporulation regulatory protein-aspartic acid phosphatase [Clostridia bacterium]|nr:Spo0E family sporulation regulatory protein-aspartic acid phosphatase [Clostridia bacterium]
MLKQIEELRQVLQKVERGNEDKFDEEIISLSQELDVLIMKYYELLNNNEYISNKRVKKI